MSYTVFQSVECRGSDRQLCREVVTHPSHTAVHMTRQSDRHFTNEQVVEYPWRAGRRPFVRRRDGFVPAAASVHYDCIRFSRARKLIIAFQRDIRPVSRN